MSPEEQDAQMECLMCGVGSKKPVAVQHTDGWDAWACKPCMRRYRRTTRVQSKGSGK